MVPGRICGRLTLAWVDPRSQEVWERKNEMRKQETILLLLGCFGLLLLSAGLIMVMISVTKYKPAAMVEAHSPAPQEQQRPHIQHAVRNALPTREPDRPTPTGPPKPTTTPVPPPPTMTPVPTVSPTKRPTITKHLAIPAYAQDGISFIAPVTGEYTLTQLGSYDTGRFERSILFIYLGDTVPEGDFYSLAHPSELKAIEKLGCWESEMPRCGNHQTTIELTAGDIITLVAVDERGTPYEDNHGTLQVDITYAP
jgi:hypothetical protein